MLKLIPIAGAILGATAGAFIDSADPVRGGAVGTICGAVGIPVGLWLLWAAYAKLAGFRVQ
jgi:hypothetical protein